MSKMQQTALEEFVYFTDSHIRIKTPQSRTDEDFLAVIIGKIREVFEYARNHNISTVLCGGDLGDSPVWAKRAEIAFINLLQEYKDIKFYTILGNHDLPGKNYYNFQNTTIGMLSELGMLTILDDFVYTTEKGTTILGLSWGHKWLPDMSTKGLFLGDEKLSPIDIVIIHDTVGAGDSPYWTNITSCNIDGCKIALFGDVHAGFPSINLPSGCWAFNPGSLTRMSIREKHRPKFLHIVVTDDPHTTSVKNVYVSSEDTFVEVKDDTLLIIELASKFRQAREYFKENRFENPEERLLRIGKQLGYPDSVVQIALSVLKETK